MCRVTIFLFTMPEPEMMEENTASCEKKNLFSLYLLIRCFRFLSYMSE